MPRHCIIAAILLATAFGCSSASTPQPTPLPAAEPVHAAPPEPPAPSAEQPVPASDDEGDANHYGATIEALQGRLAPSSQPGRRLMTILHAGQDRSVPVELTAGHCYAFLGEVSVADPENRGAMPDLDLSLIDPAGTVVQNDRTDDSNPVLGGPDARICPNAAGTYTLRAAMERGEGFMAAQMFESAR